MSDVDPLIRRELNWMALGVLENRDLSPLIYSRVRRRRIKRVILSALVAVVLLLTGALTYGFVEHSRKNLSNQITADSGAVGSTDSNAIAPTSITGLLSDYPLTWEQSIGDAGAISRAAGIGDTLGGLTAMGLKVSWQRCGDTQCPLTWILSLKNETEDLISISPALMIFSEHSPLVSASRPTTVTPGATSLLVYTFPEFKSTLTVSKNASWQWNWFLTPLK